MPEYTLYTLADSLSGNAAVQETERSVSTGVNSVARFITVLFIFALVLAMTYFTTRFVGRAGQARMRSSNIEVLESVRNADGKLLELVRIGKKYAVIGVSRDSQDLICMLDEDDILPPQEGDEGKKDFSEIFKRFKSADRENP